MKIRRQIERPQQSVQVVSNECFPGRAVLFSVEFAMEGCPVSFLNIHGRLRVPLTEPSSITAIKCKVEAVCNHPC